MLGALLVPVTYPAQFRFLGRRLAEQNSIPPVTGKLIFAGALLGLAYSAYIVLRFGGSLNPAYLLSDLPRLGHAISVDRYSGNSADYPLYIQLLLTTIQSTAGIGGVLFAASRSPRTRYIAVLTLLKLLLVSVVTTTRSGLVIFPFCWSGWPAF